MLAAIDEDKAFLAGESQGGGVSCWTALNYLGGRVSALAINTGILARPDAPGLKQLDDIDARTRRLVENFSRETVRRRWSGWCSAPRR